jgi:hypothetical protein
MTDVKKIPLPVYPIVKLIVESRKPPLAIANHAAARKYSIRPLFYSQFTK